MMLAVRHGSDRPESYVSLLFSLLLYFCNSYRSHSNRHAGRHKSEMHSVWHGEEQLPCRSACTPQTRCRHSWCELGLRGSAWKTMDTGYSHLTVNTGLRFCRAESSKLLQCPQTSVQSALLLDTSLSAPPSTTGCIWSLMPGNECELCNNTPMNENYACVLWCVYCRWMWIIHNQDGSVSCVS